MALWPALALLFTSSACFFPSDMSSSLPEINNPYVAVISDVQTHSSNSENVRYSQLENLDQVDADILVIEKPISELVSRKFQLKNLVDRGTMIYLAEPGLDLNSVTGLFPDAPLKSVEDEGVAKNTAVYITRENGMYVYGTNSACEGVSVDPIEEAVHAYWQVSEASRSQSIVPCALQEYVTVLIGKTFTVYDGNHHPEKLYAKVTRSALIACEKKLTSGEYIWSVKNSTTCTSLHNSVVIEGTGSYIKVGFNAQTLVDYAALPTNAGNGNVSVNLSASGMRLLWSFPQSGQTYKNLLYSDNAVEWYGKDGCEYGENAFLKQDPGILAMTPTKSLKIQIHEYGFARPLVVDPYHPLHIESPHWPVTYTLG